MTAMLGDRILDVLATWPPSAQEPKITDLRDQLDGPDLAVMWSAVINLRERGLVETRQQHDGVWRFALTPRGRRTAKP